MKNVSTFLAVVLLTFSVLGAIPFRLISEDILPDGSSTAWICPADLDGDGLVDLLVSTWESGTMDLYEQVAPGGGDFAIQTEDFLFNAPAGFTLVMDILDFNDNGLLDILVVPVCSGSEHLEQEYQRFEQVEPGSLSFELRDTRFLMPDGNPIIHKFGSFIDVDFNGNLDYIAQDALGVVRYEQSESNPGVWQNLGFFLIENMSPMESSAPAFGNLDGDEDPDILIHQSHSLCKWFEWDGQEYILRGSVGDLSGNHTYGPKLVDIDGDGLDDYLAVPEGEGDGLEYWRNNVDTTPAGNPDVPAFDSMLGVYPNPFNPATTIRFELPEPSRATLTVYDIHGRQVDTLISGTLTSGVHEVVWNAAGSPSGVYLTRLQTAGGTFTKRVVLMK